MSRYDGAVVGSGAAGLTAALTAKRRGASVAMIERRKIGGECTHYGRVPSKSLIAVVKLAEAMRNRARFGLPREPEAHVVDFGSVMEYVQEVVERIYLGEQPERFENLGVDVFLEPSGAHFIDAHRLRVVRGPRTGRSTNT